MTINSCLCWHCVLAKSGGYFVQQLVAIWLWKSNSPGSNPGDETPSTDAIQHFYSFSHPKLANHFVSNSYFLSQREELARIESQTFFIIHAGAHIIQATSCRGSPIRMMTRTVRSCARMLESVPTKVFSVPASKNTQILIRIYSLCIDSDHNVMCLN